MAQPQKNRRRQWLWIIAGVVILYLLWCVFPISWTSTHVDKYPHGVEVQTVTLHELLAYIGMEGAIIPIPYYHVNDEYERIVLADGKEWDRTRGVNFGNVRPSPTREYIVLEDMVTTKPIRIMDLSARTIISINVTSSKEEFPDHYNVYPFKFLRWEDDKNFLVEVKGPSYSQTWRIDAATGHRARVK